MLKLIPTILCGGAGSRLWPVSRELHPKPFIRLADGQSLLQKAWLRGAATHGEDTLMLVLAADHLIADQPVFTSAVAQAMQLAGQGKLVTFGIQPEVPETGYGYTWVKMTSFASLITTGVHEHTT